MSGGHSILGGNDSGGYSILGVLNDQEPFLPRME